MGTVLLLLVLFLLWPRVEPQSSGPARALDAILQDYAYRALVRPRPRTGVAFNGIVPANLTGIQISALRLRSGSLLTRGVPIYKEFRIPVGVIEQPYVERLVLVYHNLGNWSTLYYPLPGYIYLAPILGLLAYDASDLSAKNLPELDIQASDEAISIEFGQVRPVPDGSTARCVWLDLHGQVNFTELVSRNKCLTFKQGHFSIVVQSTSPPRPPHEGGGIDSRVWIIVSSVVGGCALLVLLSLLMLWVWGYNRRKTMRRMEKAADGGEVLRMTTVGSTKAPAAMVTRTQPTLETEYAP